MIDLFYWTKEKLNLYKRAEEHTRYNKNLARLILDEIGLDRTIWDIGCGLSYLALYLSPYARRIDCVDRSEEALGFLGDSIDELGYNNISLYRTDYRDFFKENSRGDCILLSHFLRIDENIDYLIDRFETLVIVRNSKIRVGKSMFRGKKESIEDVENFLGLYDKKLNYKKIIHGGDFGQPLRTIAEARDYHYSYTGEDISEAEIRRILISKSSEDYPYYYPKEKSTGIIIIDRR